MLKKEIKKENETQFENFIYPGVTYLTHKKQYLALASASIKNQKLHWY